MKLLEIISVFYFTRNHGIAVVKQQQQQQQQ